MAPDSPTRHSQLAIRREYSWSPVMPQSVSHVPARPHHHKLPHDLPRRRSFVPHLLGAPQKLGFVDRDIRPRPDHDYDLSPRSLFPVMLGEIGHSPPPYLLELLGQLTGNRARSRCTPAGGELTQSRSHAPRGLVQDACVRRSGDLGQRIRTLATATREEAEESESLGAEASC